MKIQKQTARTTSRVQIRKSRQDPQHLMWRMAGRPVDHYIRGSRSVAHSMPSAVQRKRPWRRGSEAGRLQCAKRRRDAEIGNQHQPQRPKSTPPPRALPPATVIRARSGNDRPPPLGTPGARAAQYCQAGVQPDLDPGWVCLSAQLASPAPEPRSAWLTSPTISPASFWRRGANWVCMTDERPSVDAD